LIHLQIIKTIQNN